MSTISNECLQRTPKAPVILKTSALTKVYAGRRAVDNLNLSVSQGEIYGFLGRNGAGKTTTIRMILGLVKPAAGYAEILGQRVSQSHPEIHERTGNIIETPGFYGNLSVYDNLNVHRLMLGLRGTGCITQALEAVGLENERRKKARALSQGMRQRLGLARALLNQPELLILDEPTNGLDPIGIREMRTLIKRLAEERHITIFMSSHILSEVQQLATRIGVINEGRLIEEVSYDELRRRSRTYLEIKVSDPAKAVWVLEERFEFHDYSVHEDNCIRVYEGLDRAGEVNLALVQNGVLVQSISMNEETLEDHFIKLLGGEVGRENGGIE